MPDEKSAWVKSYYERSAGNALPDAIGTHDPDLIRYAVKRGDKLPEDFDVALEVAKGFHVDELDQFHHQSPASVKNTISTLQEVGIEVDKDLGGEPAAHRLTRHYGHHILGTVVDNSQATAYGLSDTGHKDRLAAFAQMGVDFSRENAQGKRPSEVLKDMTNDYKDKTGPLFFEDPHETDREAIKARQFKQLNEAADEANMTVRDA